MRNWTLQNGGRHLSPCYNWCRPLYGEQSRANATLSTAEQLLAGSAFSWTQCRADVFVLHLTRTRTNYCTYLTTWKRQESFACSFAYLSTQCREHRSLAAKCWHCCSSVTLLFRLLMLIYWVQYSADGAFPTCPRFTNSSIVLPVLHINIYIS